MSKKIVITASDDMSSIEVEVEGTWNGGHTRRALAAAGKHIRHLATRAHYAYIDEQIAKEESVRKAAADLAEERKRSNEEANRVYREQEEQSLLNEPEQTDEPEPPEDFNPEDEQPEGADESPNVVIEELDEDLPEMEDTEEVVEEQPEEENEKEATDLSYLK